jgi:hypothetical protein
MEYKEGYMENGQLKFKNTKQIDQSSLTSDCWLIQFNGLKACESCELKNTDKCGGGDTLIKLKNYGN